MVKRRLFLFLLFSLLIVSFTTFNIPTAKASSVTVGTSTTNTAVYPPFLRKGFYANGRYWIFYSDGSNIVYRTSIDGVSWTNTLTIVAGTLGRFISVCFDGVYMHYAYASTTCESYGYYRKGTPNSDGTITWVTSSQIAIENATDTSIYFPYIAVDSAGYPFIGYKTEKTGYHYPYVTKSSLNNGSWATASGFPLKLNTSFAYWGVVVVPLLSSKMYVAYGHTEDAFGGSSLWGRLYNGTGFESVESPIGSLQLTTPYDMPLFSVVAINNDVYVAFAEKTSYDIHFVKRTYGTGWGSIENIQLSTTQTSAPVLTIVGTDILCFWMGSPTPNHIYYKSRINGVWDTNPTDYQNEASETLFNNRAITSFYQDYDRHVGLLYLTKPSSPYNVKFALSIFRKYTFHGLYDENSGLLKAASERAVNVTAYLIDETSSTFEVNGTYIFTSSELPLYFHFDLGSQDREYWISSTEYAETIYIFNQTLTTYTISFLDLAGALDDYPFVETQRLINGTLMTVEKRKVDVENKIQFSLIMGCKYTIIIQDGATYTFGDLLMTSTTTVQLTLKGIQFPKETLLTSKYVRIYGFRDNWREAYTNWTTPSAIHSFCGEDVGKEAINTTDDDTGTYWYHTAVEFHWIIFDMAETKPITKIRIYQTDTASQRFGRTEGLTVYVSDNPAVWGDAVWEGVLDASGWQESGAFSKSGRYVKLVSKSDYQIQKIHEFDAYVEMPAVSTITIIYQDLLNMTASVKIYINYKNGTNVYNATETSDSFSHEWANALSDTDYAVVCTIDHGRYGVYSWKNYYPRKGFSDMPFGLDWFGNLPFNTAYIIPAFLVLFAGGCFSAINKEVGAFAMVVTACLIAYMGWLPIPGSVLIVAFALMVLMALVVAKRRIEV